MENFVHVKSLDELKQAVGNEQHYWLFKHSSTCPVSAGAWKEYSEYASLHPHQLFLYLVVQEDRSLSTAVEEITGIRHESPQLFHFSSQQVDWHASHNKITNKAMKEFIA
ncbi:bacillithiol system redox-active protein YtxJ [Planococcus dechangensis]|uniref:Bacillithiol system redox-active protein YtxJ n=1 Tax=Planococcus dechangensis TaxID=1176255 RepID=A0ABV9MF17_9BACL